MKIYGDRRSGNCLKIKYLADLMGLTYEWVEVEVLSGQCREAEFLKLNAFGQVPVIELDDGRCLAQSNAILTFLARGSAYYPADGYEAAKVDEWLYWEQYSHEPYVAVSIFQMLFLGRAADEREGWRVTRAEAALDLMNDRLSGRDWLAGHRFTIADISLFAYTGRCHLGGFDLGKRPHVEAWLQRVAAVLRLDEAAYYPMSRA